MKLMKFSGVLLLLGARLLGQEAETVEPVQRDEVKHRIVIEAPEAKEKPKLIYQAEVESSARISRTALVETATVGFHSLQGEAGVFSIEVAGTATVSEVTGAKVRSWSIRREGGMRYLDIVPVDPKEKVCLVKVVLDRGAITMPGELQLTTFGPSGAMGFSSTYAVSAGDGLRFVLVEAKGVLKLKSDEGVERFASNGRAELKVSAGLSAAAPAPAELRDVRLTGVVLSEEGSAKFRLLGTAHITSLEPVSVTVLQGRAAPVEAVSTPDYRLKLSPQGYQLEFQRPGVYDIDLSFVTPVQTAGEWQKIDFYVPSAAVVPIELEGIAPTAVFDGGFPVNPVLRKEKHEGFLPASGACRFAWQPERKTSDGKMFFTSEGIGEISVGAGLLRQVISLTVRTLQGELPALDLKLEGAGEVLAVEGDNVLSWQVTKERVLEIRLSRPVTKEAVFLIRSQSAMEALPVKIEPLRMTPAGVVRHSGYFRIYNRGAVRIEVMNQTGLTQLSPDQYPEAAALPESIRQVFHYRYPAASRSFMVLAERVKPEVNVAQMLSYELTETDRVLRADLELEIREAGIREWEFYGPADYSVVSLTGAEVADYVVGSAENGRRRLKVIFGQEVMGRRLVKVHFEKNEAAAEGSWMLPALSFPGSTMVRGELGVSAAPGFRVNPGKVEGLAEMPLARLLQRGPNLQQAFRIRAEQWGAAMEVKALSQNVQADTYHFYSLQEGTAYVSVLLNYFVAGAPADEWRLKLPEGIEHLSVDGRDIRDFRQVEGALVVPLHRSVMGAYQLLVTYEQKAAESLALGGLSAEGVQAERGFIQVVSPGLVELTSIEGGENLQVLDPLELPTEYQLMSTSPTLKAWQYQRRPFALEAGISWFRRGETETQVVEYAEITSQVARDGGVVTVANFEVRTKDGQELKLAVPEGVQVREVSMNGKPVTLRKAGELFLVPLPSDVTPNVPVSLKVVSSHATEAGGEIVLMSPALHDTTQLATKWLVKPDTGYRLTPVSSSGVGLLTGFSVENGFDWIDDRALPTFIFLLVAWMAGALLMRIPAGVSIIGAAVVLFAAVGSFYLSGKGMDQSIELPKSLEYTAAVKAPGSLLKVVVSQVEADEEPRSGFGMFLVLLSIAGVAGAFYWPKWRGLLLAGGAFAFSFGVLSQTGGAGWFFLALGVVILLRWWSGVRRCRDLWKGMFQQPEQSNGGDDEEDGDEPDPGPVSGGGGKAAAMALLVVGLLMGFGMDASGKQEEGSAWKAGDSLTETWMIKDRRLHAEATLQVTGKAGERFLLVGSPATLTRFEGVDLKVVTEPGGYVVIPMKDGTLTARFSYEAPAAQVTAGVPVLTGAAAVRDLTVRYEAAGWSIECDAAVRHVALEGEGSAARLWLAPQAETRMILSPRARDVAAEETRFYAEVDDLFIPGPGVVDGRHRVKIRPAQGQVKQLNLSVPEGFTVSEVRSQLVGPWQFDPIKRILSVELAPYQSTPFYFEVETQRALSELPAEVTVSPMRVEGSAGEVGMLALAFGKEAQLDQDQAEGMSPVNLADFGDALVPRDREGRPAAALQKVYRYSGAKASLSLKVAPVSPEVRVESKQRLSFGEERTVLAVDFTASITRAGVFRLSFPLPAGFEVETLTGGALNHWVEVEEGGAQVVIMNLNGKTMGVQEFSLVLTAATPGLPSAAWEVPKVALREADRQGGQLVIVPGRGIQLSVAARKDLSALDPRAVGGVEAGSLAFRLLQKSWALSLAVDQLAPSVAAMVFQDVELREERSKSRVEVRLQVDHASIREVVMALPGLSEIDAQTVRVSGPEVRDILKIGDNRWQVRFKRRVVGEVPFRIEFEETVPSKDVAAIRVIEARQQESYLALRPGGRLRLEPVKAPDWDAVDWSVLPKALFQLDRSGAPAAFLRSTQDGGSVGVALSRHSVVAGAKIRVLNGSLTTVVSSEGELMNQAELELETFQRGTLALSLPKTSRLFGVFVNEESVLVVRDGDSYRFQVVGDAAAEQGNRARVRFTYSHSLKAGEIRKIKLEAFKIGEPLENVTWTVALPEGYVLAETSGDLDLIESDDLREVSREDYRRLVTQRNADQEKIALMRLNKASGFLKAGNQILGNRALGQVFNQGNLDDASNEDVRVKMESVARQNAVIALNTRRQRLYNDNSGAVQEIGKDEVDQIQAAMAANPVFFGTLNVGRDDYTNIMRGNNAEVNRMLDTIATKWVRNQRITEPVGRMIDPVVPAQGESVTFARLIQVDGGEALKLDLTLDQEVEKTSWSGRLVILLLVGICVLMGVRGRGNAKS